MITSINDKHSITVSLLSNIIWGIFIIYVSYLSRSAWDTWIIVSSWFVREESSKAKAPAAPKPAADTAANWAAFGSDTSAPAASSGGDNWASVFDSQPTTTTAGDVWSAAFSSQTTATTTTTASSGTAQCQQLPTLETVVSVILTDLDCYDSW